MKYEYFLYLILPILSVLQQDLHAQDCYESFIVSPSPFMGNNGEIFKLDDGSLWEVKYEYEYLYEYYPRVFICPNQERMVIDEKSLQVKFIASTSGSKSANSNQTDGWEVFEETGLEGSISGMVQLGRIFKTLSGNIYEVTGLTLQLVLELQPEVTVLRNGDTYKLIVEGFDEPLVCKCLNCSKSTTHSSSGSLQSKKSSASETEKPTIVESYIISDFNGLKHGNIYKLANGQIWEQTEYWIWVWIWINPSVLIWNDNEIYRMNIEGIDHPVTVRRIK